MSSFGLIDITAQAQLNEKLLPTLTFGTQGVCAACYRMTSITRHHVKPRQIYRTDRRAAPPLIVLLCRLCHKTIHKLETNENLYMKHNSLRDVIMAIRAARFPSSTDQPQPTTPDTNNV